jgi:hypothetical protein
MTLMASTIWWYLGRDNVYLDGNNLIIDWNGHRSGHTWRSLKATAHVIAGYCLGPEEQIRYCPVEMADESDGYRKEYRYDIPLERFPEVDNLGFYTNEKCNKMLGII